MRVLLSDWQWKVFYFDKKQLNQDENPLNTYRFRSEKTLPTNNDLIRFENNLYELICNLRYYKVTNNFQKNLLKDIASLNSSQNIIVPADKTTNLYGVEIDNKKLLWDNITATYQKTEDSTVAKINILAIPQTWRHTPLYQCKIESPSQNKKQLPKMISSHLSKNSYSL